MTTELFEHELAEGLGRLASEAQVPPHDAQTILASGDAGSSALTFQRRPVFAGVAAALVMLVSVIAIQAGDETEVMNTASNQTTPASMSTLSAPAAEQAVYREVSPLPAGRIEPRHLRIWHRTEAGDRVDVAMVEQWFTADWALARVGSVPDTGASWIGLGRVLGSDVEEITDDGGRFGFPEVALEAAGLSVKDRLNSPVEGGPTEALLTTSSFGGDSSYTPGDAASVVRVATLLLPTLMEPEARQEAVDHLPSLPDAAATDAFDEIARPSIRVSVPSAIVKPSSGETIGAFDVSFWSDPEKGCLAPARSDRCGSTPRRPKGAHRPGRWPFGGRRLQVGPPKWLARG